MRIALLLLTFALPAHAGRLDDPSPKTAKKQCTQRIDGLIAKLSKRTGAAAARAEAKKLPDRFKKMHSGCAIAFGCKDICYRAAQTDCRRLKGKAKRECNRKKRSCKRHKCAEHLNKARCQTPRKAFWKVVAELGLPKNQAARPEIVQLNKACNIAYPR